MVVIGDGVLNYYITSNTYINDVPAEYVGPTLVSQQQNTGNAFNGLITGSDDVSFVTFDDLVTYTITGVKIGDVTHPFVIDDYGYGFGLNILNVEDPEAQTAGPVDITVFFTPGTGTLVIPNAFYWVSIDSLTPSSGPYTGGTLVTISGTYLNADDIDIVNIDTGFQPGTIIFTVINSTTITATTLNEFETGIAGIRFIWGPGIYNSSYINFSHPPTLFTFT